MPEHEQKEPTTRTVFPGVWFGRVEQRTDPARLGRLRVRVCGVHSDAIQTEDLPWSWPRTPAWVKGGAFGVPPLDETVLVEFVRGHPEYPIYSGGHWGIMTKGDEEGKLSRTPDEQLAGKTQAPDGTLLSMHVNWPTSMFGGKINDGLLAMDQFPSANPDDAPNNYGYLSPHNKHWELDDRKGRQKVKLSDQQDNFYWVNSEHAAVTMEVSKGLQAGVEPSGFTASSDPEIATWQAYGHGSPLGPGYWLVTNDRYKGFIEIATPGMWKVLVDRRRKRVEVWTGGGHHIVAADGMTDGDIAKLRDDEGKLARSVGQRELSTEPTLLRGLRNTEMPLRSSEDIAKSSFIGLFTPGGREFVLADSLVVNGEPAKLNYCLSPDGSYWAQIEEAGSKVKHVEHYSAGTFKIFSEGDMNLSTRGRITMDGQTVHLNDGFLDMARALDEVAPTVGGAPWLDQPANAARIVRAPDYPYYADPEKIPGYNA